MVLSILVASGAASWLETKPATQAFWARTRNAVAGEGGVDDLREQLQLADLIMDDFLEEEEVSPQPMASSMIQTTSESRQRLVAMAEGDQAVQSAQTGEKLVQGLLGEQSADASSMKLSAIYELEKFSKDLKGLQSMIETELAREKSADAKREQFITESTGKQSINYFGQEMPLTIDSHDKAALGKLYDQLMAMKDGSSTDWMFPPPAVVAQEVALKPKASALLQTTEGVGQKLVALAEGEGMRGPQIAESIIEDLSKPQGADALDMKAASIENMQKWLKEVKDLRVLVDAELEREKKADAKKAQFVAETRGKTSFNYFGQEMPLLNVGQSDQELGRLYDQLTAMKDGSSSEWLFMPMQRIAEEAVAKPVVSKTVQSSKKPSLLEMTENKLSAAPAEFRRTLKNWEKLGKDVLGLLLNEPDVSTETQATDLVARAEAAQVELKGVYSTQLLDLAQTRVVASAVKQASEAIQARGTGESFKSDCAKMPKVDQCNCVMDAVCSFTAAGHSANKVQYCNLLVNAVCLPEVKDV